MAIACGAAGKWDLGELCTFQCRKKGFFFFFLKITFSSGC